MTAADAGFDSGFGGGGDKNGIGFGETPAMLNCEKPDPNNSYICLACMNGFILSYGGCAKPKSSSSSFCQAYVLVTGKCIFCNPGYTLINSTCTPSVVPVSATPYC
jgi:hypothetical protein